MRIEDLLAKIRLETNSFENQSASIVVIFRLRVLKYNFSLEKIKRFLQNFWLVQIAMKYIWIYRSTS